MARPVRARPELTPLPSVRRSCEPLEVRRPALGVEQGREFLALNGHRQNKALYAFCARTAFLSVKGAKERQRVRTLSWPRQDITLVQYCRVVDQLAKMGDGI